MKKIFLSLVALSILSLSNVASADTLTFYATGKATTPPTVGPNQDYTGGSKQFNLDHHYAYTWQVKGTAVNGTAIDWSKQNITSACLTFKNISNWDTNPNRLFVNLLDSSIYSGVKQSPDTDASGVPVPANQIRDYFGSTGLSAGNQLVVKNTAMTDLLDTSFDKAARGTVPGDYKYSFNASQLSALLTYLKNDSIIAFGFDPDCHFWNNGIEFELKYENTPQNAPVPEPTTMALLGSGLAGLYYRRRRQQHQATCKEE